ncbi:MAG: type VI secretion system-associated FHA domain protein TagH [Azoarcus sp.]|jgi:predicted component of type VI protein secretion system|nr:type VI secretion system-associated FHA domain protein TagH [Azoarcus sp.]
MLEIQALTYNDLPPVVPIAGAVSGESATVGRGAGNAVVLPDPMNVISRRHLQLEREASGAYRVSNISGANMVFVNNSELGPGVGCTLRNGDRISLGGYVLQVRYTAQAPAVAAVPGDDLLASAALGGAGPAPASLPEGDDPLGALMHGSAADRRDPMQTLNERGLELGSLDSKSDGLINGEDAGNMARELVSDPLSGRTAGGQPVCDPSLDPLAIFGDGGGSGGAFDDILQSGKNNDVGAAHMDLTHGSDLGSLFNLPESSGRAAGQQPPSPPPGPGKDSSPPSSGGLIGDLGGIDDLIAPPPGPGKDSPPPPGGLIGDLGGIDDPIAPPPGSLVGDLGDIDDLIAGLGLASGGKQAAPSSGASLPDDGRAAAVAAPPAAAPPVPAQPAQPAQPAAAVAFAPEPAQVEAAASPDAEELCKAFIEGLGIDLPGRTALDETFMKTLGQMLRNYAQGTVDLIASRAIVKQEVRANVTLIAPERNNPLKFSSDGDAALLYLLGKPFPGFMGPVEAVRSAFTDLRAHQIGLVSGMRSAFNHILQCFNPALIGNNDPVRGLLDQAMPSRRKARLWDAYEHYFAETQASVADRFQSFFGAAFVKAYEDAIRTLQAGEKADKP